MTIDELSKSTRCRALRTRPAGKRVWTLVRGDEHRFECDVHFQCERDGWLSMIYLND
jgi:hypothetical protein